MVASSVDPLDVAGADRWLSSLREAAERGELFVSVMPIMTMATRSESSTGDRAT